jgi:hypothetical protein
MQRYTIFFITVNALHVLGGFSAHHQYLVCANSTTLANKFGTYQMLCVQFLSS